MEAIVLLLVFALGCVFASVVAVKRPKLFARLYGIGKDKFDEFERYIRELRDATKEKFRG